MKDKYFFGGIGIILTVACLASCAGQKEIPLKDQLKDTKISTTDGEQKKTLKDESLPQTELPKTELPKSESATTFSESLTNDKKLADLSKKLRQSRIDKLADSTIICTVNGMPITIGDYRRQFKTEEEQLQASLAMNPQNANGLIKMAQENGVSLTLDERKKLVNSANKMETGGKKGFNQMLAENHMTKAQFQDQIFDVGLAFKMAGKVIEEGLLNELVSRKLLSQAAKQDGFSKEALNKYAEVSKSPQYKRLLQVSGISTDDLRNEVITNELCLKEIEKIKSESPISDLEISNYYEKNRGKFRHDARVRMSQIFIARNEQLTETPLAMQDRIQKANPKLSEKEVRKQVTDFQAKKEKLARELLERARKGEDFAALANQYSDDLAKTGQKNGGDVGFQEESKLDKQLISKIDKVPVGGITSDIIVSPYGFHIFKITGRESKGFYTLNEIKDTLKQLLAQEKGEQVVQDWLADTRQKATISISPELKDLIAANKLEKRLQ